MLSFVVASRQLLLHLQTSLGQQFFRVFQVKEPTSRFDTSFLRILSFLVLGSLSVRIFPPLYKDLSSFGGGTRGLISKGGNTDNGNDKRRRWWSKRNLLHEFFRKKNFALSSCLLFGWPTLLQYFLLYLFYSFYLLTIYSGFHCPLFVCPFLFLSFFLWINCRCSVLVVKQNFSFPFQLASTCLFIVGAWCCLTPAEKILFQSITRRIWRNPLLFLPFFLSLSGAKTECTVFLL